MSDSTAPTLTAVSIASNNSTKTDYACYLDSDIVTLTITADESISQPTVVFTSGGDTVTGSVTYGGSGTSWTAAYTVNTSDTLGVVGYTINFSDTVGNAGVAVTSTTDDSQVMIVGTTTVTNTESGATTAGLQIGATFDGQSSYEYTGWSVSLSSDGTILAIGTPYNDGTTGNADDNRGHVRVYQYSNSAWTQLGNDIDGKAAGDSSGYSVSLSSDGTIVAIGAPYNDDTDTDAGHVRVYQYSNSDWTQLGNDIDGEIVNDQSGFSLSLSSDGAIVAIGAPYNDGNGTNSGHVRVYQYSNSSWTKLGDDIDGEYYNDQSGYSVSLSSDGSILAIGAPWNSACYCRVYQYSNSAWTQLGSNIVGERAGDQLGWSVSLSSDGTIVAIGATYNGVTSKAYSGHVRVYQRDESNTTGTPIGWTQLGDDIEGETSGDLSGYSVSLSSDGTIVAIGAHHNDGPTYDIHDNRGHVRVYQYDANKTVAVLSQSSADFGPVGWTRLGADIDGEAAGDKSGYSVSLSSDGSIVAIGSPYNDSSQIDTGHVRVFETGATKISTTTVTGAAIPPEISALTIISNNTNTTAYATQDDTVTISMTYDLSLSEAPTLAIQSGSADITNIATLTGADTTWSAAYIVDPSDTDGLVSFTIDASTNFAGVQSTSSEITNASTMTIDMTPPAFSSLYSSKNNNIRITFSEPVYNTNTATGNLEAADFVLTSSGPGTLESATPSEVSLVTDTSNIIYDISYGIVEDDFQLTTITVKPVDGASIYDTVGLAMAATPTSNTFDIQKLVTITNVAISTDNDKSNNVAIPNNSVTIDTLSDVNMNQPDVAFTSGGNIVTNETTYNGSGTTWISSFLVSSSDSPGIIGFSIDYKDLSGNVIATTTDNTTIYVGNDAESETWFGSTIW